MIMIVNSSSAAIVPAIFVTKGFVHILDMKDWNEIESLLLLLFLSLLMAGAIVNFIGI